MVTSLIDRVYWLVYNEISELQSAAVRLTLSSDGTWGLETVGLDYSPDYRRILRDHRYSLGEQLLDDSGLAYTFVPDSQIELRQILEFL